MKQLTIFILLILLVSCNKKNQIQEIKSSTVSQDCDSTKSISTQVKNEPLVVNLSSGFVITAGDCESFDTFRTYSSISLSRNGSLVYADKEKVEYEFGDKSYPIVLKAGKNKFEILLEVNDRPNKNYLERLTIENDKVVLVDTLPTFISKPFDYDKDGFIEYAGFWDYSEVWGEKEDLTAYNPIIYYSLSKDGLLLDSALTIEINRKIYGDFYGYHYNENQEMPIRVVKKFEDEISMIEKSK